MNQIRKKRFNHLWLVLLILTCILSVNSVKAQDKSDTSRVMIQLNPGISVPVIKAWDKLYIGANVSGSVHFTISNSFKLGPDLSYQINIGKIQLKVFM